MDAIESKTLKLPNKKQNQITQLSNDEFCGTCFNEVAKFFFIKQSRII